MRELIQQRSVADMAAHAKIPCHCSLQPCDVIECWKLTQTGEWQESEAGSVNTALWCCAAVATGIL